MVTVRVINCVLYQEEPASVYSSSDDVWAPVACTLHVVCVYEGCDFDDELTGKYKMLPICNTHQQLQYAVEFYRGIYSLRIADSTAAATFPIEMTVLLSVP